MSDPRSINERMSNPSHSARRRASTGRQKVRSVAAGHQLHWTRVVKLQGILLNPDAGGDPRFVNVYDDEDWALIHRNPSAKVKCRHSTCETLLTAKRMSRSGQRFFAIRRGGCTHDDVTISLSTKDVEQDPSRLPAGGGPETDEHRWIKGRIVRVAEKLGIEAILEEPFTHSDVYLPGPAIAVEYQRWNTKFNVRTEARATLGASTLWLIPSELPDSLSEKDRTTLRARVFQTGALFLSVSNMNQKSESQHPLEAPGLAKTARLYVGGSAVRYDETKQELVRYRFLSLATFLREVSDGSRMLKSVPVRRKDGRFFPSLVWITKLDLALIEASQRRTSTGSRPTLEQPPMRTEAPRPSPPRHPTVESIEHGQVDHTKAAGVPEANAPPAAENLLRVSSASPPPTTPIKNRPHEMRASWWARVFWVWRNRRS